MAKKKKNGAEKTELLRNEKEGEQETIGTLSTDRRTHDHHLVIFKKRGKKSTGMSTTVRNTRGKKLPFQLEKKEERKIVQAPNSSTKEEHPNSPRCRTEDESGESRRISS